jgi:trehalose/maltose hydrolase-like predicted phosphorylase
VSPGGIATNAYNGHVFWDMDTWVFPVRPPLPCAAPCLTRAQGVAMLWPDHAAAMLEYRAARLLAATAKAAAAGYQGAAGHLARVCQTPSDVVNVQGRGTHGRGAPARLTA